MHYVIGSINFVQLEGNEVMANLTPEEVVDEFCRDCNGYSYCKMIVEKDLDIIKSCPCFYMFKKHIKGE